MSRELVVITRCNVCQEVIEGEAFQIELKGGRKSVYLDLCDAHAKPVMDLIELGDTLPPERVKKPTRIPAASEPAPARTGSRDAERREELAPVRIWLAERGEHRYRGMIPDDVIRKYNDETGSKVRTAAEFKAVA